MEMHKKVSMEYNHTGDIKLGDCSDTEQSLFDYLKTGPFCLKKTELNEYYLSVPICIGSLVIPDDFFIYTKHIDETFYFADLYVPQQITCIKYDFDKNIFVSNQGCDFKVDPFLYEILPYKGYIEETETEQIQFIKKKLFSIE